MDSEALLRLALQAFHDHTAQPVLGDAVLESGWYDYRVIPLVLRPSWASPWHWFRDDWTDARSRTLFAKRAARPDRRWCRAVAAVLMFGDWPTKRFHWPHTEPLLNMLPGLDSWLPSHSDAGSFFGLNREPRVTFDQVRGLADSGLITGEQALRLLDTPSLIRQGSLVPVEPPTAPRNRALADMWERETNARMESARRLYSQYLYSTPPPRRRRTG